jgi:hypothetical protein
MKSSSCLSSSSGVGVAIWKNSFYFFFCSRRNQSLDFICANITTIRYTQKKREGEKKQKDEARLFSSLE